MTPPHSWAPVGGLAFLLTVGACGTSRAEPCPEDAAREPGACIGVGTPAAPTRDEALLSVSGAPLQTCSRAPLTGYFRDGLCRTGPTDRGVHVVCAEVDAGFLAFTAAQGNDLSTPSSGGGFPGLRPGDRWCLCAARWAEAEAAGHAPPVILEATHAAATRIVPRTTLENHAR